MPKASRERPAMGYSFGNPSPTQAPQVVIVFQRFRQYMTERHRAELYDPIWNTVAAAGAPALAEIVQAATEEFDG